MNSTVTIDYDTEMLRIVIEEKCIFEGNFWDFDRPEDILKILKTTTNVELIEKEYDFWYK